MSQIEKRPLTDKEREQINMFCSILAQTCRQLEIHPSLAVYAMQEFTCYVAYHCCDGTRENYDKNIATMNETLTLKAPTQYDINKKTEKEVKEFIAEHGKDAAVAEYGQASVNVRVIHVDKQGLLDTIEEALHEAQSAKGEPPRDKAKLH